MLKMGEEYWTDVQTFTTDDNDIIEEELTNFLPIELKDNKINIPGYIQYSILYTSKIIVSNDLLQLFEWNKENLKIVPVSRQHSTNNIGSVNNLDKENDPYANAIYGYEGQYVWESEDNYDAVTGEYLIANSLVEIMYEHQLGEWLQVDLGESKPIGFMTLRPICGNTNKLLNPSQDNNIWFK